MSHKWNAKVDRTVAHEVTCTKCGVKVERVLVDGKFKNFHTPLNGEQTKGLAPKCTVTEVKVAIEVTETPTEETADEEEYDEDAHCRECGDELTRETCSVAGADTCDACEEKITRDELASA